MGNDILRLGRDALVYGSGRYLQQAVGFFLIPLYTRYLVPADYGIMDTVSVFQAMLGILCVLGLDSAFARFYLDAGSVDEKRTVTGTVFLFRLTVISGFAVLTFLLAGPLATAFYGRPEFLYVFRIVSLLLLTNFLYSFFLEALRFNFEPAYYAFTSVTSTCATILLTMYLVIVRGMGVMGIFASQAAVLGGIGFPLAFWKVRRTLALRCSGVLLRQLLRYGLPLVPAAVSYWILTHSNRYFLLRYASLDDIGVYAVAEKFVRILVLVVTGFQLAWGPFAFSVYREEGAHRTFSRVFSAYLFIMCTLAATVAGFSRELVVLMTQPAYYGAGGVIPFMIFTPVAIGAYYIVSIGVNIEKKTQHVGWTTACAAGLNVMLNILLIPRLGIVGAAISTSASYLVSAALLFIVAQNVHPIPYRMLHAAVGLGAAAVVIAAAHSLPEFSMTVPVKIIMLLGMMGLYVMTGMLPVRNLTSIARLLRRRE